MRLHLNLFLKYWYWTNWEGVEIDSSEIPLRNSLKNQNPVFNKLLQLELFQQMDVRRLKPRVEQKLIPAPSGGGALPLRLIAKENNQRL